MGYIGLIGLNWAILGEIGLVALNWAILGTIGKFLVSAFSQAGWARLHRITLALTEQYSETTIDR